MSIARVKLNLPLERFLISTLFYFKYILHSSIIQIQVGSLTNYNLPI